MFYSEVILARKGPLGKIWLAAHFDKKLTRNQIFATDISSSVESVLNPTSPLALRVSGHLMLGIVRIYSRKVSYLMTECKEAIWKINLAFRPGTFDMDPNSTNIPNIFDSRHFGNIDMENELPDLENTEFHHMLLPEQDNYLFDASQAFSTQLAVDAHTLQDYSLVGESPQMRFSSRGSRQVAESESRHSHISELELTRFERSGSISSHNQRTSMSSARGGRPSGLSMEMGFEDDIPAFQEQGFDVDHLAPAEMLDFGNDSYIPSIDEMPFEETKGVDTSFVERQRRSSARVQTSQDARESSIMLALPEERELEGRVDAADGQQRKRRIAKRRRVLIDNRVELPSRLLKQRMDDLAPILRSKGMDGTVRGGISTLTGGVRGLCSELQAVFNMSINEAPLPFPLKNGVAAFMPTVAVQQGRDSELSQPFYSGDLELTRAPRDSEASVIGGRPSTLYSSSVVGKEDTSFGIDEAATEGEGPSRFSLSSRMQGSHADEGSADAGGFGCDDYAPMYDAPLAFRVSSPGPGIPSEESKLGSGSHRRISENVQRSTTNAISELVSSTLTSLGTMEPTGSISAESSRDSSARNTRTEHFMDILKDEFSSKGKVSFAEVTSGVSKRVAAAAFLEVLQLKTWGRITAAQRSPFEDIMLAPFHSTITGAI